LKVRRYSLLNIFIVDRRHQHFIIFIFFSFYFWSHFLDARARLFLAAVSKQNLKTTTKRNEP